MLLDTSGLLCFIDASEQRHKDALRIYQAATTRVTHNYVIAESVALAQARRYHRDLSLNFSHALTNDPEIEVAWVDASLHLQALDLLRAQLDKRYSLCDAVSFVLMSQRKISEAFTTDHHFTQAGYQSLLSK